jgi:hypothetical protein
MCVHACGHSHKDSENREGLCAAASLHADRPFGVSVQKRDINYRSTPDFHADPLGLSQNKPKSEQSEAAKSDDGGY